MRRTLQLALVASMALGPIAGCGGDEGPPSKEERGQAAYERERAAYVEEADARCRRIDRRIHREIEPVLRRATDSPRAAARLVEEMAPRVEYEIRAIRILVLPQRDVPEVLDFLSAWYDDVQEAKRDPTAFVEAGQPFPDGQRLARRFGFQVCAAPLAA
ncbi:MAG TPA: hypothetical protein VEQ41_09775 [Solirubrobacterales bacterium]|nr:hypothetical protein [Solirubrobacterales bacterium]